MRWAIFLMVLAIVSSPVSAPAEVPGLISYQGTLTDENGVALDTTVVMMFTIYADSLGEDGEWYEYQTVEVNDGLFNILLGRVNAIPEDLFNQPSLWLEVTVVGESPMTPLQRIASVGYSFRAALADTAQYARGAPAASDGDWTISGSDIFSAVSGNVGIGTALPMSKLEVTTSAAQHAGHFRIDNVSNGNATILAETNCPAGKALHGQHSSGTFGYLASNDYGVYGSSSSPVGVGVWGTNTSTGAAVVGVSASGCSGILGDYNGGVSGQHYSGNVGHLGDSNNGVFGWSDSSDIAIYGYHNDAGNYGYLGGQTRSVYGYSSGGHAGYFDGKIQANGAFDLGVDGTGYDVNFFGASSGGKLLWNKDKMAFRAGRDGGSQWVGANVGYYSFGANYSTRASGTYSSALGYMADASGEASLAMGRYAEASGDYSFAMGRGVTAGPADYTMVFGRGVSDGTPLVNNIANSFMVGFNSTTPALFVGGSGNRVGIGLTDPIAKLDVSDVIRVQGLNYPSFPNSGKGMELAYRPSDNTGMIQVYDRNSSAWGDLYLGSGNVGIGTTTPTENLHVVGDIYCTGKLTSDGGNDPPYVLYNHETREAIIERVAREVPQEKRNGAVLFWNGEQSRFEVYLPDKGQFRDLSGSLIAEVLESDVGVSAE